MLSKSSRIKAREFKGMKARPAYRGALFDISIAPAETTKFACIISKKRIKRATDRNKAKRKIYALLAHMTTASPYFILIYPTKSVLDAPHEILLKEVNQAFATL